MSTSPLTPALSPRGERGPGPGFEKLIDREHHVAEIRLSAGRGNVIDRALCERLAAVFGELGADRAIHCVILSASGPDFSWGASVPEHMPGEVDRMLPALHGLAQALVDSRLPVAALVRGRCLGGALELVLCAHHVIVAENATLGLPEVKLGVFPPLGATLLPFRVSQPVVDRMVTRGDVLDAAEAVSVGLADELTSDAALADHGRRWASAYETLSGSSIRFACEAARRGFRDALGEPLTRLEALYLGRLLETHDGVEGVRAFVEKRTPRWQHR
ncbi:MAG: enoyl-CoA hydratase/isomerase family protein [Deltaproteobacteria bacterium]|nr:enoyl-CoA hydratase/isomerase family protein [Deltaproteobacteria bacterium]